jgi:hypothetical protein
MFQQFIADALSRESTHTHLPVLAATSRTINAARAESTVPRKRRFIDAMTYGGQAGSTSQHFSHPPLEPKEAGLDIMADRPLVLHVQRDLDVLFASGT